MTARAEKALDRVLSGKKNSGARVSGAPESYSEWRMRYGMPMKRKLSEEQFSERYEEVPVRIEGVQVWANRDFQKPKTIWLKGSKLDRKRLAGTRLGQLPMQIVEEVKLSDKKRGKVNLKMLASSPQFEYAQLIKLDGLWYLYVALKNRMLFESVDALSVRVPGMNVPRPIQLEKDRIGASAKEQKDMNKKTDKKFILEALNEITGATEAILNAAKDTGSSNKDKEREAALTALVHKSATMCQKIDLKGFPEVAAACKQVDKLNEMSVKMKELQVKLKAAPANTEEASQNQEDLDALRSSIDTMLSPLNATLETMEAMAMAAAALEEQFAEMSDKVKAMEEKLKADKEKLSSIAKAVETTAKLG